MSDLKQKEEIKEEEEEEEEEEEIKWWQVKKERDIFNEIFTEAMTVVAIGSVGLALIRSHFWRRWISIYKK